MMEIAVTVVVGLLIVAGSWRIYKELVNRGIIPPPAQISYRPKRPEITLDSSQEQELWEDIIKRLKK